MIPRAQGGQASVELLGAVPGVLLVAAFVWQLALTGHTAWVCANAARVGARAEVVGGDTRGAVRSALPRSLERELRVDRGEGDAVRVRVRLPLFVRSWRGPVTIGASARLAEAR